MVIGRANHKDTLNIHLDNQNSPYSNNAVNKEKAGSVKQENGTVFAGGLSMGGQDQAVLRKEEARKQALKMVADQFSRDSRTDQTLTSLSEKKDILSEEVVKAQKELEKVRGLKQEYKDYCNVPEDSQEQKDLELLEKSVDEPYNLTKEEKARLENMGPLTAYQKNMLEYHGMEKAWQKEIDDASAGALAQSQAIGAIKQERLKKDPMVSVQKEAAAIMEEAAKDIAEMLIDEAKEHIDETMEEEKEKAEEAEEKKAEEPKTQEQKEAEESRSAALPDQDIQEAAASQGQMEQEIKELLQKNSMMKEDLKGIIIDSIY